MRYTVIIMVDGDVCGRYSGVEFDELERYSGLHGPDLWGFGTALKLTGTALDVTREGDHVMITIGHEEI